MAFEKRNNSGVYLYLSRRDPATGQVQKVYLGRGPRAEAAAQALATRRKQRAADRLAVENAESKLRAVDELMGELDEAATLLLEAVLIAEGFHRENYGPWRKRRNEHGHGRQRGAKPIENPC